MPIIPLPFFSDGHRLDADLHLPDDGGAGGPYPIVIVASGYQGLKVIHPERFARALTPRGYAVLAFDYRGFGLSEGERGRLVAQEWVLDVRAAVDRVCAHPDLDADKVALIGWGLGGGVVVAEAADDPRVKVLASCNGIADGYRSTKKMHDDASWTSLLDRIEADRGRRTEHGRSEITSPWDIVRLDLDGQTDGYVGEELYKAPGFGAGVNLESADYLLRFRPVDHAARLTDQPLLVVHGENNQLHKLEEGEALFAAAQGAKQLEVLEGKGHTEWMFDEDPTFKSMTDVIDAFFRKGLGLSQ
ncbi:alpha/beta hydrolase [Nocardioides sp.]|uniref:alpha/beta hydrolase n=1 Tax=Nocardioides sp. TaxID=35761 RepID=UPI002C480ADD|nr:alpha/beta hydrolase [Nocardioides sp.]HXH77177.1 alpha/beta hydrolase [Nocardioides sp.]